MISLVAAAQIPVLCIQQRWQQVRYTRPFNPKPPPSMVQYAMLPRPNTPWTNMIRNNKQYLSQDYWFNNHILIFQPRQDANMPLQSATEASSVTSNENSETQMSEFNTCKQIESNLALTYKITFMTPMK